MGQPLWAAFLGPAVPGCLPPPRAHGCCTRPCPILTTSCPYDTFTLLSLLLDGVRFKDSLTLEAVEPQQSRARSLEPHYPGSEPGFITY